MMIGLGGALLLTGLRNGLFDAALWLWLVVFYLTFLGFEIALIVRQAPKVNGSPQA